MGKLKQPKRKRVSLARLKPAKYNPRDISDEALAGLGKSIERFGLVEDIVWNIRSGNIVGGHQRYKVVVASGAKTVEVAVVDLDLIEEKALNVALNNPRIQGVFTEALKPILQEIKVELPELHVDLQMVGLEAEIKPAGPKEGKTDPDAVPDPPVEPVTKLGDIWELGPHRVLCGDCTDSFVVSRVGGEDKAALLHADPPYGMGKEKDGIANDNLYREKLDVFQMAWWAACRPLVSDVASVYVWGQAQDLWRLWWGQLSTSERMTFRNEVVWDKGDAGAGGISHQGAEGLRQYPTATERCLFFMLGEQGFNTNKENYWDGWESVRAYLAGALERSGLSLTQVHEEWCVKQGTKGHMVGHWFGKSQWAFPTRENYVWLRTVLNKSGGDYLKRDYDDLKRDYDDLKREWYATRAFFDNTHDNMTDVWRYGRVHGADRYGHPTPKPVELVQRAIKSSSRPKDAVLDPFLGSGTTLIACEQLGRVCRGIEIEPRYVDVVVKRWEQFTGKKARRVKA